MKWTLALILVPTFSFAAKIPLEVFAQQKLETLLRNIPSSVVKTEQMTGYVRKHHSFPLTENAPFKITCYADYFGTSEVPSLRVCEVEVSSKDFVGDEYAFKLTDDSTVKALAQAIPYKAFISHERVYGQGHDGVYRNLFRYSFICKDAACDVTFATKE